MANTISLADYQEQWRVNAITEQPDPSDKYDVINLCPQQLGKGYERWIELRDINLLIINAELHDDLVIYTQSEEDYFQEL
jgi:AraC family transcriptional regulator, transcriptional activator of the genes for pyochelin and ferripyochelin receptors